MRALPDYLVIEEFGIQSIDVEVNDIVVDLTYWLITNLFVSSHQVARTNVEARNPRICHLPARLYLFLDGPIGQFLSRT